MAELESRSFEDIIHIKSVEDHRKSFTVYEYNGKSIPRVNEILEACIGKPYLQIWASKLGKDYIKTKRETLAIGSLVHEMCEYFMNFGADKDVTIFSNRVYEAVYNSYNNFKSWYNDMKDKGYIITPLFTEQQTTNPWFGGTIDCIVNIKHPLMNIDQNYIIDYKTSKKISPDYILQTYAYLWSWNWNRQFVDGSLPYIHGIGIIRIGKEFSKDYNDLFISDSYILSELHYNLSSMVNWFYSYIDTEYLLKESKKIYKENGIYGINERF